MPSYKLSPYIWISNIVPCLIANAIRDDQPNPIYDLRLVCKYFKEKIFAVESGKRIMQNIGLTNNILKNPTSIPWRDILKLDKDKFTALIEITYIKEISILIQLEQGNREYDMIYASSHGHVNILQWWLNLSKKYAGIPKSILRPRITYTENAIDDASANGHINVLNWWKQSGLVLHYTKRAINDACKNGHNNVLRW